MQSAPLLYKDGDQTRQCHHQHGDESGKLAQNNGEAHSHTVYFFEWII